MRLTKTKLYINKDDYTFMVEDNQFKYTTKFNTQNDQKIDTLIINKGFNYSNLYINEQLEKNIENKLQINENGFSYSTINTVDNNKIVSKLLTISEEKFEVNNITDISLNSSNKITLNTRTLNLYGGGISLWGCNSNISIDDLNSEYAMYINGMGNTVIFGNSGKLEFIVNEENEGTVELASYEGLENQDGFNIKLNSGNNIDIYAPNHIEIYAPNKGISLLGCNSQITIDDLESDYDIDISASSILIFSGNGKLEFTQENGIDISSISHTDSSQNQYTYDIKLNSSKDIILNAAENQKVYYVHDNAEPTANNEIATVGTVSGGYIPNAGNTENNIDFALNRKSVYFGTGNLIVGIPNNSPYFSMNPGQLDVSTQGTINLSAAMGAIYLTAPGKITLRSGTTSNDAKVSLTGSALKYNYKNTSFQVDETRILLYLANNYYYKLTDSEFSSRQNRFSFNQSGDVLNFTGDVYKIDMHSLTAQIYSGTKVNNEYPHRFGFNNGLFSIQSDKYMVLRSYNSDFTVMGHNTSTGDLTFQLRATSGALTYQIGENQLLNINSGGFDIYNTITLNGTTKNLTIDIEEGKKAYYIHDGATPTDNDEIATKGDIVTPDMSNYVLKTDFNDLLEKYNDLCERLNEFLEETGEIEPEPDLPTLTDELITVPTNHVSITLNANNFYLDWGDGSEVETIISDDYVTKTHDYTETKVWKIKIGPNDENATGDIEAYSHEDESGTDPNQFTEVNLNHLTYHINDYGSWEDIANSTTITTYKINYPTTYDGCGFAFLVNCPNLAEVYFGPLTEGIGAGPIKISDNLESNLTSIYLDLDTEVFESGGAFMFYRQSLTDFYFYNEIPIPLYNEDAYYYKQTYLTDEEYWASQRGEPIDVSGLTIHVPSTAVDVYKSAPGWSIYTDRIVGDI